MTSSTAGRLEGRVAIVTGAGRGLGRAHAMALAEGGAAVVVNDLGGDVHGAGADLTPAQVVVKEIEAGGGRAVVSGHDVADWAQAKDLVDLAVDTFGGLDVLVNNAGILRDRLLANMGEAEWDDVVRVHLKGHAAPTRHAVAYWRERAKGGAEVAASVVHTTSGSGFVGSFGQANYSAAKMAVIGLSHVVATEYGRFGVRSNVISPMASSRMGDSSALTLEGDPSAITRLEVLLDPANVAAVVAWLAERGCPATKQTLHVYGNRCMVMRVPSVHADLRAVGDRWTPQELDAALSNAAMAPPFEMEDMFAESGLVTATAPPATGKTGF